MRTFIALSIIWITNYLTVLTGIKLETSELKSLSYFLAIAFLACVVQDIIEIYNKLKN